MLFLLASIFGRGGKNADDSGRYSNLISENLKFIEQRCYKAYGIAATRYGHDDASVSNKADALLVEVLDHLKADDFRVLREYKGRSSIRRYLEVVISNKVVDLYRSREGRSRAAEEARKMGDVGVRLYELVFEAGLPVSEAHDIMAADNGYTDGIETLEEIAERIRGRRKRPHTELPMAAAAAETAEGRSGVKVIKDESGDITVPDESLGPEVVLLEDTKRKAVAKAMADIARLLTPEERLMVKMRFNGGMKVKEIAAALGLGEKRAYRIFDAILGRCRKMLADKGFGPDDLL